MALKKRQDRLFLLKLDRDFCNFIENTSQEELEFPWLNSYYRMMIHRSAIYFQLARKVDPLHKRITLSKTEHSAIPILRFCDLVEEEDEADEKEGGQSSTEPSIKAIKVLKRCQLRPGSACEARSADSCSSSISGSSGSSRRAVSMEQREKEYAEARARIFCQDENGCCSAEPPGCLEETVSRIEEGARTRGPVEMDDIHRESVKVMSRQHSGTGTQELLGRRTTSTVQDRVLATTSHRAVLGLGHLHRRLAQQWDMTILVAITTKIISEEDNRLFIATVDVREVCSCPSALPTFHVITEAIQHTTTHKLILNPIICRTSTSILYISILTPKVIDILSIRGWILAIPVKAERVTIITTARTFLLVVPITKTARIHLQQRLGTALRADIQVSISRTIILIIKSKDNTRQEAR
ncbi:R3H domain-containing protein 1 [Dissophora ornata]|nr:R3H domain-containing protein 1 [Dissophora ornata]